MNPDDYITGTFNSQNPANMCEQLPELSELEEQQEWNQDLLKRIEKQKVHLKKLAQFEESFRTFGFLSYEETTEKNNILNQYL